MPSRFRNIRTLYGSVPNQSKSILLFVKFYFIFWKTIRKNRQKRGLRNYCNELDMRDQIRFCLNLNQT